MKTDIPINNAAARHQGGTNVGYSAHELLARTGEDLGNYQTHIARLFANEASRIHATKVLDFGGGTGDLASRFQRLSGVVPKILEIDPLLRQSCEGRGFKTHASLDSVGEGLDMIYSSNVLEHIEDDAGAVRLLRERLRVGGVLVVYLPAFQRLWGPLDERVGHFRRYDRRSLRALLEKSGFSVQSCHYADSVGFAIASLYNLLPARDGEPSSRALRIYDRFVFPPSAALDKLTRNLFGKNVVATATRFE